MTICPYIYKDLRKIAFSKVRSLLHLLYKMMISQYVYIKKREGHILESQLATQFTVWNNDFSLYIHQELWKRMHSRQSARCSIYCMKWRFLNKYKKYLGKWHGQKSACWWIYHMIWRIARVSKGCRALLVAYRALLVAYRALLVAYRALLCENIGLFCESTTWNDE